jgi:hypothetical protein
MNNGKYHTASYLQKQEEKASRRFGPVEEHTKTCEACEQQFTWTGRKNTKAFERARFCSRKCANTRGGTASSPPLKTHRTIAEKHLKMECAVCGFSDVVEIHHIDEDHSNNAIENLVPLCPNHHRMIHKARFKDQLTNVIAQHLAARSR